jgi:hypothetical protein
VSFAAPLFLLGLLGAALPVAVHLIGRYRAPRRPFAALFFVLRAHRRLDHWRRLRQLLLLAVRVLLVAAVAVMMAKPFAEAESDLPAVSGRLQSAVLVLDDTLSMRRVANGGSLFDRARERALELVSLLGPATDLAVLRVSKPTGPLPVLVQDARRARSALLSLQPTHRYADSGAALLVAARILGESTLPERNVFLLSDLAAHGEPKGVRLPAGIGLHEVDIARDLAVDNRAIVEAWAAPSTAPGARVMQIGARVCNYSKGAGPIVVSLEIEGRQVAQGPVTLSPFACATKTFHHAFLRGGLYNASLSIAKDDLREDDRRYLRLEVESGLRVLIVNGAPSSVRHRDELFYLETALLAATTSEQAIATTTVTAADLAKGRLEGADVVALCNVGSLPKTRVSELEAFVRRGGGLLFTLGDNVDADVFNRAFSPLLPQELRGPVQAATPGSGEAALRVGKADGVHPVSAIFAEGAGLGSAQFVRVFRLKPATVADRRVVLSFDDGSPALVEGRHGEGRVLLYTSTIDRDWNDLPIRPGFLPLVQQMVRFLARAPAQVSRRALLVGDTETIAPPQGTRQVRLVLPGGEERIWTQRLLSEKPEVEIPIELPGVYRLSATMLDGTTRPLERESFVANVDPRESDLRRGRIVEEEVAGGARVRAKKRLELWHSLGTALLALLLAEALLTRRG